MSALIVRLRRPDPGVSVHVREHEFVADVLPPSGSDAGPTPHDLYDSALASCKAMTVALYASRKGIPVEDIEVSVERDASREHDGEYSLAVRMRIGGSVSESQLRELDAVALKCPIHKLMTLAKTNISTSVERTACG
jgi:putative redox protein